jgi:hypothetical protein
MRNFKLTHYRLLTSLAGRRIILKGVASGNRLSARLSRRTDLIACRGSGFGAARSANAIGKLSYARQWSLRLGKKGRFPHGFNSTRHRTEASRKPRGKAIQMNRLDSCSLASEYIDEIENGIYPA